MRRLLALLILLAAPAWATTYYVDCASSGGDGTTEATSGEHAAFATIAAAQAAVTGDQHDNSLLFKRGCTWRETLTPAMSGTSGHPFTIGKYGTTGADPIINGATVVTSWTLEASGGSANLTVDANMQAYWMLEEASGTRADGTANANNLTDNNTVTQSATHKQGSYSAALASANKEYLSRTDGNLSAAFPGKNNVSSANLTAGGWVQYQAAKSAFLWKGNSKWALLQENGTVQALLTDSGGTHTAYSNVDHTDYGVWHHFVIRFTGATKELALFINGVKQNSPPTCTDSTVPYDSLDFNVGSTGAEWYHVNGLMDEVFVMDRALSDAEILGIVSDGLAGSAALNLYYTAAATEPVQTFSDDTRFKRIALKANLIVGTCWWDDPNDRLYVRLPGDDSPAGHTMEIGARDYCVDVNARDYLNFSELYCDKANNTDFIIRGHSNYINSDDMNFHRAHRFGWRGVQASSGAYTLDYITVTNSTATNCGGPGIILGDGTAYGTVSGNVVHENCLIKSTDVGGVVGDHDIKAGIKFSTTTSDVCWHHMIEKNVSYNNGNSADDAAGMWLDGPVTFCTIRYNLVYENTFCGIKVEDLADDNVVVGNVSYDNHNDYELGGGTHCYRTKFYNNVAYSSGKYNSAGIKCRSQAFVDNEIKNNISIGHNYGNLVCEITADNSGAGSGNVYEYNCFGSEANEANNFIEYGDGNWVATYDAFEALYGASSHSIEADPLFTNAAGGDFTLQAGSPCIDAGVDLTSTYQTALMPGSTWVSSVLTGSQYNAGQKWECGAYLYPNKRQSLIIVSK